MTDALLLRINYHRHDPVAPAPPAGMPDVCELLAERNAVTHVLQHQPNPASGPTPPPAPRAPAADEPHGSSSSSSPEFVDATVALLDLKPPASTSD